MNMARLSKYEYIRLLMRVCAYMVSLSVCPGDSTWPVSGNHRSFLDLGLREYLFSLVHQLVSWFLQARLHVEAHGFTG